MAGVVAAAAAAANGWGLQGYKWSWPRAEGGYHLHDVWHHHVGGAHGAAALQHGAIRLLLDVYVRFDGYRLPAARRVDGDLLIIGAGQEAKVQVKPGASGSGMKPTTSLQPALACAVVLDRAPALLGQRLGS